MSWELTYDENEIGLRPARASFLEKAFRALLTRIGRETGGRLAFALADLRVAAEQAGETVHIDTDQVRMGHRTAALLDSESAEVLGLPSLTSYTLRTDTDGIVGSRGFKVLYEWYSNGVRQFPKRTGCLLKGACGVRRIPLFMMEAIEVADQFTDDKPDHARHWEVLSRFRSALGGEDESEEEMEVAGLKLSQFLQGLEVKLADCLSISPKTAVDGRLDFDVVPFSRRNIQSNSEDASVSEEQSELGGEALRSFQEKTRSKGALPAYRVAPHKYLVIDRATTPALSLMVQMYQAAPDQRDSFVRNPKAFLAATYEAHLRQHGKLEGLTAAGEEEAVERELEPMFVETREFSERVIGIQRYSPPPPAMKAGETTWLPEGLDAGVADFLLTASPEKLVQLQEELAAAARDFRPSVSFEGHELVVTSELQNALQKRLHELQDSASGQDQVELESDSATPPESGPLVVASKENFDSVLYHPIAKRRADVPPQMHSTGLRSTLKIHQAEALHWQIEAWASGLPGVLNADEQGLGKTLETLAFLRWCQDCQASGACSYKGPVLIVAPTSLLENWEQECGLHLDEKGLGHLIRLYGTQLGGFKVSGLKGTDVQSGEAKLNFELLQEAIEEGRGHRFWILTTYTTVTNYQHSLAKIRFSTIVFDEIQALKNPFSLRACAARALNGDFRIGLTGTPIENETSDLWAVLDQLSPGRLDSLKSFKESYSHPSDENMRRLHEQVFLPREDLPALAIRRTKSVAAKDLPAKRRSILPRLMPRLQEQTYDLARLKLAEKKRGAALKLLHHIRSISVHPTMSASLEDEEFESASARLKATMDILRRVRAKGERALVFIESRRMQERFIQIAKRVLGLSRVDLINGDTPIHSRQMIVTRFQGHLKDDRGFDLLVLGPKAAGTGLTLTAATHVIHLSRWWNPAVEEQCNDRVHRIGQRADVMVHIPMAIHPQFREHSFDCLLHSLMTRKRRLAAAALWPMGDSKNDVAALGEALNSAETSNDGDPILVAMTQMFLRDNEALPKFEDSGEIVLND